MENKYVSELKCDFSNKNVNHSGVLKKWIDIKINAVPIKKRKESITAIYDATDYMIKNNLFIQFAEVYLIRGFMTIVILEQPDIASIDDFCKGWELYSRYDGVTETNLQEMMKYVAVTVLSVIYPEHCDLVDDIPTKKNGLQKMLNAEASISFRYNILRLQLIKKELNRLYDSISFVNDTIWGR